MRAPDDHHLHQAAHLIQRMRMARPTCDGCETASYAWARHLMQLGMNEEDTPREFMYARGYEEAPHRAGYVKRCDTCANGRLFPWADKLDAERVADFLEHDVRCQSAFELAILEETLQGKEPIVGFEYHRVGSTDICIKCLLLTGESGKCVCKPEDKFFLDLRAKSGTEIKATPEAVEYLHQRAAAVRAAYESDVKFGEPMILPETQKLWEGGQCALCGEKWATGHKCNLPDDAWLTEPLTADEKSAVDEADDDNPRGGFEFL